MNLLAKSAASNSIIKTISYGSYWYILQSSWLHAKKTKRKASPALMKPMTPSATLAVVVGSKPIPRGQITKNLWAYIKKNGLQDKTNKRQINADDKLKAIFGGKSSVSMFEMTKLVSKHIS